MKPARPAVATRDEALAANVRTTLATATQVLEHFHQSLLKSGFVEGADSYSKLAATLVGQKMWSVTSGVDTEAEFATIAALARNIHEVLAPYHRAMLHLSTLGGDRSRRSAAPEPAATAATSPASSADAPDTLSAPLDTLRTEVLRLLAGSRHPMSVTAIRAECRCDRRVLAAALAALEQAGRVKRQDRGGRTLYGLDPSAGLEAR